jgi:hypothetical protein
LLLVLACIEGSWEFCIVGADVPKEDSESVNIYGVVVGTGEKFRCHVDGCSDYGACHHGLGFAESKICADSDCQVVREGREERREGGRGRDRERGRGRERIS